MPVTPSEFGIQDFAFPVVESGGSCDYPAVGDVQEGVSYGSGSYLGTFEAPNESDVRNGIQYGADGTEYTGTLQTPAISSGTGGRYAIDEPLRAFILSMQTVAEKIGNRMYADDAAPQTPAFPYGVITMIGDAERWQKLQGSPKTTLRARYQIDFFARKKSDARAMAAMASSRYVDGGLDGLQATIGSVNESAYVQSCRIENRRHDSEQPEGAGEERIYNAGFDAVIVFNE